MLPFSFAANKKPRPAPTVETGVSAPTASRQLEEPKLAYYAIWVAIALSVFEGPTRYLLAMVHLDSAIFIRDALLLLAPVVFVASRNRNNPMPASVGVFFILMAVHAFISLVNIRSAIPAIYGLKMFIPVLCGFLAGSAIFNPTPKLVRVIFVFWVATVVAAALDQYVLDYPWVGINVELGGVDVFLGRDWQSGTERVGGLMRSSINLAVGIPLLTSMLLISVKQNWLKLLISTATFFVLVWTTQKGAILAFVVAMGALLISSKNFTTPLKTAAVVAIVFMIFAPTVLIFVDMPRDAGVFSFQSFIERIESMWPAAWKWIGQFPPLLGVGLGGIGGGQRFFAPDDRNAADNLFVYLYGNFGIMSVVYLFLIASLAMNARNVRDNRDLMALASLVFLLMYGVVVSLIEDQLAAMWLGAAIGWLIRMRSAESSPFARLRMRRDSPRLIAQKQ
ncbi:hypothetical protein RD110_10115 [Rhodoferax koreense]|uniref:O-antigen polymerase n=1 Tax=Rhodoferax koreensis TaxID=1842727 RepID=A0A1P8JUY6_9BURK|nr:hypothetical protein [Rhodoferax koreense]APW37501.1 hypothetical protein RD110_10115 [Rhodoferax koreense]